MDDETPSTLGDLAQRLTAIEQDLEEFQATLVVIIERLSQLRALFRTDHRGLGRGGLPPADD